MIINYLAPVVGAIKATKRLFNICHTVLFPFPKTVIFSHCESAISAIVNYTKSPSSSNIKDCRNLLRSKQRSCSLWHFCDKSCRSSGTNIHHRIKILHQKKLNEKVKDTHLKGTNRSSKPECLRRTLVVLFQLTTDHNCLGSYPIEWESLIAQAVGCGTVDSFGAMTIYYIVQCYQEILWRINIGMLVVKWWKLVNCINYH